MFVKRLILLFIVAVFIFLAVPQASNLFLIWRDYHAVAHYVASYYGNATNKNDFAGRIPATVVQQDPEAVCIASYMLNTKTADDAAAMAIQYPGNQFFWVQLAESLPCHEQRYDPQIIRLIADRLIALDPKNADYYILKASAILQTRVGDDINEVLPLLHQAAQCPHFDNHYELYRSRVMTIADKVGLGSFERSFLQHSFPIHFSTREVWNDLLGIAQMKFNDGRTAEGIAISDALNNILYSFGSRYFNPMPQFWGEDMNICQTPAFLELREAAVSPERAHYDHLLLASAALAYSFPSRQRPEPEQSRHYVLAFPLLLHCARMAIVIAVILAVLLFMQARGSLQTDASIGVWNSCLFAVACLFYFIISNLHHWITFNTCCGHHLTYMTVLVSGEESLHSIFSQPLRGIIWLLITFSPLIILLIINKISHFRPILRSNRARLAGKIAVSLLLMGMLFLSFGRIVGELTCPSLGSGFDGAFAVLFVTQTDRF